MEYTEIRGIIKGWCRYSQVHFLMPNIPWCEMASENYPGTYTYWTLIPRKLLWEWESNPLFKAFVSLINTQSVVGMYMVILEGVVDRLVEMDDYISSGKEVMVPLSGKYAAHIESGELRSLYYIGKCENYWDVNISKINIADHAWNFTVLKKTSLFNAGISQYAEIMDDPNGKEVWDKMRKWVCFDLVSDPDSKPPYILKTTQRELHDLIYELRDRMENQERILALLRMTQEGRDSTLDDFRAQFGLSSSEDDEE